MEAELLQQSITKLMMSYEEYLDWTDEANRLTEWVDGEVIIYIPPKHQHQTLLVFFTQLLGLFVQVFDLGHLQVAPFELKIRPDGPSRKSEKSSLCTGEFYDLC